MYAIRSYYVDEQGLVELVRADEDDLDVQGDGFGLHGASAGLVVVGRVLDPGLACAQGAQKPRITSYNVCYTKLLRGAAGETRGADDEIGRLAHCAASLRVR